MRSLVSLAALLVIAPLNNSECQAQPPASITPIAPSQRYVFAGTFWGESESDVKSSLDRTGYTFVKKDEDGDLNFTGQILGYQAVIFAFLSRGQLVRMEVVMRTPDNMARSVYKDMQTTLTGKYGSADHQFEFFTPPYESGDGYEDQAIRVGKGHFASFWQSAWRGGQERLELEISEKLTVVVDYESPAWEAESDARQKRATKVF